MLRYVVPAALIVEGLGFPTWLFPAVFGGVLARLGLIHATAGVEMLEVFFSSRTHNLLDYTGVDCQHTTQSAFIHSFNHGWRHFCTVSVVLGML
jgi:hypothetical protein